MVNVGDDSSASAAAVIELTEDEKSRIFELVPDLIDFVSHIAKRKKMTLQEAATWCIKYTASRHASLDKYEVAIRCESCKKKSNRCKCKPEVIAANKARRDAAERQAEIERDAKGGW